MSRQIDVTKKLSDEDRRYLQDRDRHDLIAQADQFEGERQAREAGEQERLDELAEAEKEQAAEQKQAEKAPAAKK